MRFTKKRFQQYIFIIGISICLTILPVISTPKAFSSVNTKAEVYIDSNEDQILNLAFNEFSHFIKQVGGRTRINSYAELKNIESQLIFITHGTPEGIQLKNNFFSWAEFDKEISNWKTSKIILLACFSAYSTDPRVHGSEGVIDAGLAGISAAMSILPKIIQPFYERYYAKSIEPHINRILSSEIFPLASESTYEYAYKFTKSRSGFWPFYIYERTWWINLESIPELIQGLVAIVGIMAAFKISLMGLMPIIAPALAVIFGSLLLNSLSRPLGDMKFGFVASSLTAFDYVFDMGGWFVRVPYAPGYWGMCAYQLFKTDGADVVGWDHWEEVDI
jgi:hypothetical protein